MCDAKISIMKFQMKESYVGGHWGGLWVEAWGMSKILLGKMRGSGNSESAGGDIREYLFKWQKEATTSTEKYT